MLNKIDELTATAKNEHISSAQKRLNNSADAYVHVPVEVSDLFAVILLLSHYIIKSD